MDRDKKIESNSSSIDDIDKNISANQVLYDQLHQSLVDEACKSVLHVLTELEIVGYQKKPNDIYIDEEKIAGILLSNVGSNNDFPYQALSVGININSNLDLNKFNPSSKITSTSLLKHTGNIYNR